ncbi:bis-aminopropyl spermidine synthase family protein [Actinokineospora sp.]|uniref:bis-aminopropyl spermidine synthase family protein n=1 Tax=Actinokineospora sp. TaxID=1872133 RepID=UPI004037B719
MADSLNAFLAERSVHTRPLRALIALLCTGWRPLDELVRTAAVPRRTVEDLLAACDAERDGPTWRIAPSRVAEYLPLAELPPPPDDADLRPLFEKYLADVPLPLRALDHVQADVDTMLRRARWLDDTYDLRGARLLCVGDHDLTALAACTLRPGLSAVVVDLDDSLLAYIDHTARERGLDIRCLHADFRFGLPPAAVGSADLVFTDPPYTPEGMRLFLARGVEGLRAADGRVVVAYGYSERNPALGLKVQQEILRLGLVFEAVLPAFNRYLGAQAVGSASDLYVLQPTGRSPKLAEATVRTGIYTHGPQSVESGGTDPGAIAALLRLAQSGAVLLGPGWSAPVRASGPVAYDLMADPGPWLARTLVAGPRVRVAALVGNNHPDITDQRGQQALRDLVAAKYRLTFHRSTPDGKHAVVVAEPVPGDGVAAELLDHAHGKLGNVWREALIRASDGAVTKREARERVAALVTDAGDLDLRLIDLPRHRLRAVLEAASSPA